MMAFNTILLVALLAFLLAIVGILRVGRRPKDLPPGPPTIPILGNLHQMPQRDPHVQFSKWAKEYGPVYSLILGTSTVVVLSSDRAVKDLLDKRSSIYSDRPKNYIGMELCSGGLRMLFMPYDRPWRVMRKLAHNLLHMKTSQEYVPYQMLENKQLLHDLVMEPQNPHNHLRRYANSLTTSMVFGWRTPSSDNADFMKLFSTFEKLQDLVQRPASQLMDCFPILQWLPDWIVPVKAEAKAHFQIERPFFLRLWLDCKTAVKEGRGRPCFCVNLAKEQEIEGFDDDQAAYQSGTIYEAGSETTSSQLYGFVQAMVVFQDVQKRAQQEIDDVVGLDRLPTIDDEPNLPYIRGCVKEVLRWMPTATLGGAPHAVTRDDWYMGYRIPKGAAVVLNIWGIHTDPQRYPRPRLFDPARYATDYTTAARSANVQDPSERDHFGFGAGRRFCPGTHVAERSLFLAISRMLWTFDFCRAQDADGIEIIPNIDKFTQGFAVMPEQFDCEILPRSDRRTEVVMKEWEEARRQHLDESGQWKV